MQFQVALYAIAAKKELQYQPDQGLVRYLDADDKLKSELRVPLDAESLERVKTQVAQTASKIRQRHSCQAPRDLTESNAARHATSSVSAA